MSNRYRLLSIDPGTDRLGIAISDVDMVTNVHEFLLVTTINIPRVVDWNFDYYAVEHGYAEARAYALGFAVHNFIRSWEPDEFVSEAPYMGRFPQAFASLTKAISSIREAIRAYNVYKNLTVIDPATVKKCIGVSGNSGDKLAVASAVLSHPRANLINIDISTLDEHSFDAMAVGLAYTTR